ncbi:hypothetical protein L6452_39412 [Arctium lappa]|uniref:Uncharacterized protein n=1 Tax=Arctium lappa TaxID=4217 RepID=A0ACB8XT45_ARCLA|nr:hypothetical protein L6452_39412 [Arctium lappa]
MVKIKFFQICSSWKLSTNDGVRCFGREGKTQNRSQYQYRLLLSGGYVGGGGVRVLHGVRFRRFMDGDAGGADVVPGDDVGGFGPDGLANCRNWRLC